MPSCTPGARSPRSSSTHSRSTPARSIRSASSSLLTWRCRQGSPLNRARVISRSKVSVTLATSASRVREPSGRTTRGRSSRSSAPSTSERTRSSHSPESVSRLPTGASARRAASAVRSSPKERPESSRAAGSTSTHRRSSRLPVRTTCCTPGMVSISRVIRSASRTSTAREAVPCTNTASTGNTFSCSKTTGGSALSGSSRSPRPSRSRTWARTSFRSALGARVR